MASIVTRARRLWRSERGAEFVEMALAFPLLLIVVLGILDFGMLFQQYEVLTNAAREGARIAVLPAYQANLTSNVTARVNQYINAAFLSQGGTVTVAAPTISTADIGGTCITTVTVTVTYPHEFLFVSGIARYFNQTFGTKTLTASSTMRSEVPAGGCS
jgi:Flp pilus assembly protein TadG